MKRPRVFQGRRLLWLELAYLAPAFAVVYFLWNSEELSVLLAPLRLLVTFIHETGHALMAIATGGELSEFVVSPNGAGFVRINGGNPALIAPAGYLGAALFGAWLFVANNRLRSPQALAYLLGAAAVVFSGLLFYFDQLAATPWRGEGSGLAILIGVGAGGALLLLGWVAPARLVRWLLLLVAMCCSLEALLDISAIAQDAASESMPGSDMHQFARITNMLDARSWALIWLAIALAIFALALRHSYRLRSRERTK